MKALCPRRVLTPDGWRDDHGVLIDGSRIEAVLPLDQLPQAEREPLEGELVPGFIDVQVNGGGGVLFNDAPSVDGIAAIAAAHRRFGTTGLLPTLISDDLEVVAAAITAVDGAIAAGVPGVLGIHIEGPFLNAAKKGIHDESKFRRLDARRDRAARLAEAWPHRGDAGPGTRPAWRNPQAVNRGVIVAAAIRTRPTRGLQRHCRRPERLHASLQRHDAT
jgi:N-acetylglucosamine-6-phosphate deacetylase